MELSLSVGGGNRRPEAVQRQSSGLGFDTAPGGGQHPGMASKRVICPPGVPPPVGPYSPAVRVGDLLFCSGQIPLDPTTGELVSGDIRAQTEQVLRNLQALLQAEGLDFGRVVKTTVFLTDLADFAAMNEVYARAFLAEPPARTTVQVAALPRGARVEIEVLAHY